MFVALDAIDVDVDVLDLLELLHAPSATTTARMGRTLVRRTGRS